MRLLEFTADVNTVDQGEYDREGDMARGQLQSIISNAQRVHDMLEDNDNLAEWVQSKITLAEDYISTVANYMMSEVDEEVQQGVAEAKGGWNSLSDEEKESGTFQKSHATQLAAAQAEMKRRREKGEDMTGAKIDKSTYKIVKPKKKDVAEANGRRYSSYNDELSSRERDEQNYMDQSESDFKRAEMQHELGHEDDPNFERNLRQQQLERDQGPWYIRIDGKIYRQSGQPKVFDLKNGANNYALAMIKNNPSLQGKVTLSKSEADR